MTRPRPAPADHDAHRRLGQHLLDVVRRQDAVIPAVRRAPRTVAEMRARLATVGIGQNDACPLCGLWNCDPSKCPPSSVAPAPVPAAAGTGMQCEVCGGWFGVTPAPPGPVTAWTCSACQNLGH
ncbi:hypothetical protein [Streptomyces sp. NPDC006668]|uniref:hypothetical protein n=1 Tax=Streptomyces sp. NPDC006668 TaxID=3156903 RepID=UPI0033E35322